MNRKFQVDGYSDTGLPPASAAPPAPGAGPCAPAPPPLACAALRLAAASEVPSPLTRT